MWLISLPLQITISYWYRCGAQQSGDLGSSSEALDGILGFGQSNSSMISQLAAAGRVRKVFAHCLDTVKGGGIFAIGNVVEPKVKTTPLIPKMYVMLDLAIKLVCMLFFYCFYSYVVAMTIFLLGTLCTGCIKHILTIKSFLFSGDAC